MFQAAQEIGLLGGPDEDVEVDVEEGEYHSDEDSSDEDTPSQPCEEAALSTRENKADGESSQTHAFCKITPDVKDTGDNSSQDTDGDGGEDRLAALEDLSQDNKTFRPFRNESSNEHVNAHVIKGQSGRARCSDSMCSTSSTSSTMDPKLVRSKVKSQLRKHQASQFARRVRKGGEASIATKERRVNMDNIKQSTGTDWF